MELTNSLLKRQYHRLGTEMAKTDSVGPNDQRRESFGRWWGLWSIGVIGFWLVIYVFIAKLFPSRSAQVIYGVAAVHILATVLVGPVVFRAMKQFKSSQNQDFRMFFLASSLLLFVAVVCWIYGGLRIGLLPQGDALVLYVIGVFGSVLGPLAAFWLRKRSHGRSVASNGSD
jgi:hypothetical protein